MNESLEQVLTYIHHADTNQLSEIVRAVTQQYGAVCPDWEISFLSLPKNDPIQRQQMLCSISQLYEQP